MLCAKWRSLPYVVASSVTAGVGSDTTASSASEAGLHSSDKNVRFIPAFQGFLSTGNEFLKIKYMGVRVSLFSIQIRTNMYFYIRKKIFFFSVGFFFNLNLNGHNNIQNHFKYILKFEFNLNSVVVFFHTYRTSSISSVGSPYFFYEYTLPKNDET